MTSLLFRKSTHNWQGRSQGGGIRVSEPIPLLAKIFWKFLPKFSWNDGRAGICAAFALSKPPPWVSSGYAPVSTNKHKTDLNHCWCVRKYFGHNKTTKRSYFWFPSPINFFASNCLHSWRIVTGQECHIPPLKISTCNNFLTNFNEIELTIDTLYHYEALEFPQVPS